MISERQRTDIVSVLSPSFWDHRSETEVIPLSDGNAQRVKGTTEEARSINAHLETIKGSLRIHESRLIALGKTVMAEFDQFFQDRRIIDHLD